MKHILSLSILLITVNFAMGQRDLRVAERYYDEYAYQEAIQAYERYLENSKKEPELDVLQKLGDANLYLSNIPQALNWYRKVYEMQGSNISDQYYLKYIQALRGNRDYEEAEKHTKKYIERKHDETLVKRYVAQKKLIDSISDDNSLYTIKNLEAINTPNSDFGPAFYGDKVVYASSKDSVVGNMYSWNKQPFLSLYAAIQNGDTGDLAEPKPFLPEIASKYHDATLSFTKNLDTVYYTTNIRHKKNKLFKTKEGTSNFHIIRGILAEGKLIKTESLPFNSTEYSTGHPSIRQDGKYLFFVSDMPGGYGETDIYVTQVFPDGSVNTPKNLGPTINTEGREMFPFVKGDTLYFSSDGHYGVGGLDIFSAIDKGDFNYENPKNLGRPVNSNRDDFSFIIDSTEQYGYFASNRLEGKGDDDIYSFRKEKPACDQFITGTVTDSLTKKPIAEVKVTAFNKYEEQVADTVTNTNGVYQLELPCEQTYRLVASKPNYTQDEEEVTTKDENKATIEGIDFVLTNYDDLIKKEDDKEMISVNPIYFDFDSAEITPKAITELDKVVFVMREFPKVKIKIESHTDARGSDKYNLQLSQRRAKSTQTYIISKGIDATRIESAKGYGETQLKNHCSNGVKCTDEEHELNRRSDFIIIEK